MHRIFDREELKWHLVYHHGIVEDSALFTSDIAGTDLNYHNKDHQLDKEAKQLDHDHLGAPPKQDLLEEALRIVTGSRQQLYGAPSKNFIDTAELMSAYLHARGLLDRDRWLEAYDVAILIDCLKTARIATSPQEKDHWVDKAGYSACGWEAALESKDKGDPELEGQSYA